MNFKFKARPLIFGISTAFMFFNFGFTFEIFPYWLILVPTLRKINFKIFYSILIFTFIILFNLLFINNIPLFIIDSLQFLSLIFAFLIFRDFNNNERFYFFKTLSFFIWLQFFVMILQSNFQIVQDSIASLFSGRDQSQLSSALLRNNAVTGFSPEPSYGSALLVGMYFLLLLNNYNSKYLIIPVLVCLFLFKSVYGFLLFYIFWMMNYIYNQKFLRITLILNIILIVSVIYGIGVNFSSIERLFNFAYELFESGSLLEAQYLVSPDSTRLDFLNFAFNYDFPYNYNKSISVGVFTVQVLNVFLIFFIIIIIFLSRFKYFFRNISILILSLFITPLLVWPLALSLISFLKFKSIKLK